MKNFFMFIAISAMVISCSKDDNFITEQKTSETNFQIIFDKSVSYSELEFKLQELDISKQSVIVTHNFNFLVQNSVDLFH
jgi:hypothetical protein